MNFHLPNFQKRTRRPDKVLVVDLGTTSVKAAVVDLETLQPTLLGFGRQDYPEGTLLSGLVADWESFVATAAGAIRQASLSTGFTPEVVSYSLSGEFVKSVTVEFLVHRQKTGSIQNEEIRRIRLEVEKLIIAEAAKEYERITGSQRKDFRIVGQDCLALTTPAGVLLDELTSVFEPSFRAAFNISFISRQTEKLLARLSNDLNKRWSVSHPAAATDQALDLSLLLSFEQRNFSALVLNLGGQVCDVAVVFEGKILGERTVPLGLRELSLVAGKPDPGSRTDKIFWDFFFRALEDALVDILGRPWPPVKALPVYVLGKVMPPPPEVWPEIFDRLNWRKPGISLLGRLVAGLDNQSDSFEPIFGSIARLPQKYAARQL